jgi:hypothetical protein
MWCGKGAGRAGVGSEGGLKHCEGRVVRGGGSRAEGGGTRRNKRGRQQEANHKGREMSSANGGEWASKKCGRDAVEGRA